ncbi:hypothetical protein DRJ22_04025 [Candidatus Woesearchaeota archaeon]|nr:MAG: hypothetical protein DRJ22_04025 [Candidatus Woesearchaeota archaeon]
MAEKKETKETILTGQPCPMCRKKTLVLTEREIEVPYFGKVFVFSMTCENCKYHKADVEIERKQKPCKCSLEITNKKDLNARIIKSSEATVKIPYIGSIEPGPASQGFVTNVEGIINRIKKQVENLRDNAEEQTDRKKAKNLLKKINKILWGQEKAKIIIEDPTGNSAIISEKAKRSKL